MTHNELYAELKSLGLPVAYYEFKEKVTPPYIAFYNANNSSVIADNQNYVDIAEYRIELYTDKKDLDTEKLVQDKLKELRLPYTKLETYITEEELYQIVYTIQII